MTLVLPGLMEGRGGELHNITTQKPNILFFLSLRDFKT